MIQCYTVVWADGLHVLFNGVKGDMGRARCGVELNYRYNAQLDGQNGSFHNTSKVYLGSSLTFLDAVCLGKFSTPTTPIFSLCHFFQLTISLVTGLGHLLVK